MAWSIILDVLLALALISYLVYGFRYGLSRSAFVLVGSVAGVVAAFFLAPVAATWVPSPQWRPIVAVAVVILLIGVGHAVGSTVGRTVRSGVSRTALSGIDRLAGGAVTAVVGVVAASVAGGVVAQMGVPVLSQAVVQSRVLGALDDATPALVDSWIAQLRSTVSADGIPALEDLLDARPAAVPDIDTGSAALDTAAASVLRISGNAYSCGVSQTGTGFVIADDRVITNAHVVAGVDEPVVEAPDGQVLAGSLVYFDPADDLAVIAVPGLDAPALPRAETRPVGETMAVLGYPYGGPFTSSGAEITATGTVPVADIYGQAAAPREIQNLAATVREGNSGGPLLTLDGEVAGVVFARGATDDTVGYSLTMAELDPVADAAPALGATVDSGACLPR